MRRILYNSVDVPFLIKGKTVEPNQTVRLYTNTGELSTTRNSFLDVVSDENCKFEFNNIYHIQGAASLMMGLLNTATMPNKLRYNIAEISIAQNLCNHELFKNNPNFRLRECFLLCSQLKKFIAPNLLFDYKYWANPHPCLLGGLLAATNVSYVDVSGLNLPPLTLTPEDDDYAIVISKFQLFAPISASRTTYTTELDGSSEASLPKHDITIKCRRNFRDWNEYVLRFANVNWIFVD